MKRVQMAALATLALFVLMSVPIAQADYEDNFSSYPIGSYSPWQGSATCTSQPCNPWGLTTTGTASCTSGTETVSDFRAPLPPSGYNAYAFGGSSAAGCFSGVSSATLAASLNATAQNVQLIFYYYVPTTTGSNSTPWLFSVSVCGEASSTVVGLDHATAKWYKVAYQASVAPSCTVSFTLESVNGGSPASVSIYINGVVIKGADAEFGKANLFLETYVNQGGLYVNQWMNITDFAHSYVVVNYTSGSTYTMRNVTAPDVYVPLTGASLVTVYVGQYCSSASGAVQCTNPYFVSLLPTSTTHQIVYLTNPIGGNVIQYVVQVADYSQQFPVGTSIYVYGGLGSSGTSVVASGSLDGNSQFSMGLSPGRYSVTLKHGSATYVSTVTLSATQTTDTITVPSIQLTTGANAQSALVCTGLWTSSTQITEYYADATTTTSSVSLTLYDQNASGTYQITTATFSSGPYGTINNVLGNGSGYTIFHKYAPEYTVTCSLTNTFGTLTYPNANGQPVLGGGIGKTGPSFPDVLNFAAFLPNLSDGTGQIGAYALLTTVAAGFGEFFGPIGTVIVALFAAFFTASGWIQVTAAVGIVFVVLSVVGLLTWLERRNR